MLLKIMSVAQPPNILTNWCVTRVYFKAVPSLDKLGETVKIWEIGPLGF